MRLRWRRCIADRRVVSANQRADAGADAIGRSNTGRANAKTGSHNA
jgi:hypothetical protein